MKHTMLLLAAAVLTACGSKYKASPDGGAFSVDSVGYEQSDSICEVRMCADYPANGPATLVNILREYICEEMGVNTQLRNDGKQVMREAGAITYEGLKDSWNAIEPYDGGKKPTLYCQRSIRKIAETDRYITYLSAYDDYQGGAHGIGTETGTTFRKSDGRRFGWEMLKKTDSNAFRLLLKEGVRHYLLSNDAKEALTDEGLQDMLLIDGSIDYMPLPQFPPYLTKSGIVFTYQSYEIGPYAIGRPTFTFSYKKLEPYLSSALKEMIEQ